LRISLIHKGGSSKSKAIVVASGDEDESSAPSRTPSPTPLPPITVQLAAVHNGKEILTIDQRSVDLNVSYDQFIQRLDDLYKDKLRVTATYIKKAQKTYKRGWWTRKQAGQKSLPPYVAFRSEEDYNELVKDVRQTADESRKNNVDKMVLRITALIKDPPVVDGEFSDIEVINDLDEDDIAFTTTRSVQSNHDMTNSSLLPQNKRRHSGTWTN
jgi:hypothetical protein